MSCCPFFSRAPQAALDMLELQMSRRNEITINFWERVENYLLMEEKLIKRVIKYAGIGLTSVWVGGVQCLLANGDTF